MRNKGEDKRQERCRTREPAAARKPTPQYLSFQIQAL